MVTENIRPTKELQKIMDDLLKRIDDIFSFKKTTRTLIKSKESVDMIKKWFGNLAEMFF